MLVLRHNIIGEAVAPPVHLDRRRRRLSTVVKRHAPRTRPFIVSVHRAGDTARPADGLMKLRKDWAQTLVGADNVVVITQVPMGPPGGNAGLAIGGAIALTALAIALPFALPVIAPALFAAGTFATAAASAGIVMGAAYLIGKVTQPKANTTDDPNRPLYGVSGGGNLPRPGDRIPAGYGHFWCQPDLSQPDYSVYDGEDQLLYKRMTLGLGKYQVHKIQLGTATVWNETDGVVPPFAGALGGAGVGQLGRGIGGGASTSDGGGTQVEIIQPGALSSLVPSDVFSSPAVGGSELPRLGESPAWAGPFRATRLGKPSGRIQLDWSVPQGLTHGTAAATLGIRFQYAPCDDDDNPTGAWADLYVFGITAHTTRGARFSPIVDVPAGVGNYIARGQNTIPFVDGVTNVVTWDGLRAHYAETITRPFATEIALKIRSGKSLGITAFGSLYVEATRILPVWTGSAWVEQATRKAVYAFKDIMQASYGAGLADSQVDLERIKFYAANLSANDTFDGVIRGPVSVWEAAATALGPMRSEPARIANTWSINRDEAKTVRKHHVTRRQIVRNSSAATFKIARDDGAADVIAEYAPDGDPRRRRQVRVTFGAQSLTPSRIQLTGVSDHDHAHHLATWKAIAAYKRRERRKITLDRRGRLLQRGDLARIDNWFMAAAETRAAGLLSRAGLTFTLDTNVIVGGATYTVLRDRKNLEWGPVKVTAGSAANIIVLDSADVAAIETEMGVTLANALSGDNQEMTSLLVGPLTEFDDSFLIESVTPQGRDRVALEGVFDSPDVWTALAEAPPAQPPLPSMGDAIENAVTILPWVKAYCAQKGVALVMEWTVGSARGAASNVVQISYDAEAGPDPASWEPVNNDLSTSGSYPLRHVEGVAVKVAAYAVNRHGVPGPAVYATFLTFKPEVNLDTSNLLVVQEALGHELDAKIRQVTDQFPQYIAELREGLGEVSGALASHASSLREAHGRSIISLGERYQQNAAAIDQVAIAFATADEAIAALITTLTATVGGNTAAISSEIIARANGDTALAGEITTLTATVGGNTAAISSETVARAAGDSTLAGRIEAFLATSGSGTAEGKIRFIAASAPSGVTATFAVEVNVSATSTPSWQPSGIYLDAMIGFSRIRLVANQIKLSDPGIAGGAPFDMFTVAAGIAVMNGALYVQSLVANSVLATHIAAAQIATSHIVGASISVADAAGFGGLGGNGAWQSVATVTLTLTDTVNASKIPILLGGKFDFFMASGINIQMQVLLNGTFIFYDFATASESNLPISSGFYLTGNGGTVTATIDVQQNAAAGSGLINGSVSAAAFKR